MVESRSTTLFDCQGKVRFETFQLADKTNRERRKEGRRRPYKCRYCNGFHLGTSLHPRNIRR